MGVGQCGAAACLASGCGRRRGRPRDTSLHHRPQPRWSTRHLRGLSRLTPGLLPAAGDNPAVRFNLRATYTFGAPRVGNVEFSKTFLVPPLYRVVNNLDLVPLAPLTGVEAASFGAHLPGFVPAWIREMARQAEDAPFYADVETLIHLDNDGNSTEGGSRPDWLTAYTKQALKSLFRSLDSPVTDHFIDSYIQALSR